MKIVFQDYADGINIFIPKELLQHAAENNPDEPIMVKKLPEFQTKIIEQLSGGLYDQESGLTKLKILIDEAISESVINGDDSFAEFKDND